MNVLIIGQKYQKAYEILKVSENDYPSISFDFLLEENYRIDYISFYLNYDVIISPYRFCLLHLSLRRIKSKKNPFIILASGSFENLDYLVKCNLCDRIESKSALKSDFYEYLCRSYPIKYLENFIISKKQFIELIFHFVKERNELKSIPIKIDEIAFKQATTMYLAYLAKDGHGFLPKWGKAKTEDDFLHAKEYYYQKKWKAMSINNLMYVNPSFPVIEYTYDKDAVGCFMIMPFKAELDKIYLDIIKPTVFSMNIAIKRGDDFFTDGHILQDIWNRINQTDFIVADLTSRNPNVFYELGIAHTIGKPTILLSQNIEDVPFDLRHNRIIIYGTQYDLITPFKEALQESIKEIIVKLSQKPGIGQTDDDLIQP